MGQGEFRGMLRRHAQQFTVSVVGENVDKSVRSLAHIANALAQIAEQFFFGNHLITVKRQAGEMLPGEGTDKQRIFPFWKFC